MGCLLWFGCSSACMANKRRTRLRQPTDAAAKKTASIQRSLFPSLLNHTVDLINSLSPASPHGSIQLSERLLELLSTLESQLPTRRFFHLVLQDRLFLERLDVPTHASLATLSGLARILASFVRFPVDEQTGQSIPRDTYRRSQYKRLEALRMICFARHSEVESFKELSMVDIGTLIGPERLAWYLNKAGKEEVDKLAEDLGVRTEVEGREMAKEVVVDAIVERWGGREMEKWEDEAIYPDEVGVESRAGRYSSSGPNPVLAFPCHSSQTLLWNPDTLPESSRFNNTRPLPIPRLGLQYLSVQDHLLRNYSLFRLEAAHGIREDLQDAISRVAPRYQADKGTVFGGWARMAVPVENFAVVQVGDRKMGSEVPSKVVADVRYDLVGFNEVIRREWDSLRPHDVGFLVQLECRPGSELADNFKEKYGVRMVRGCEILSVAGEDNKVAEDWGRPVLRGTGRTLKVALDPGAYQADIAKTREPYSGINLFVRRKAAENNFKAVLETIRGLVGGVGGVPEWLKGVFLGGLLLVGDLASVFPLLTSTETNPQGTETRLRPTLTSFRTPCGRSISVTPSWTGPTSRRASRTLSSNLTVRIWTPIRGKLPKRTRRSFRDPLC